MHIFSALNKQGHSKFGLKMLHLVNGFFLVQPNTGTSETYKEIDMRVINVERFANHLRTEAHMSSQGKCAKYVRQAIEAGGGVLPGVRPYHAKDYGPTLRMMGYRELRVDRPDSASFMKGDVVAHQPLSGGNASGHIAGFDGHRWYSDFKQADLWGGQAYRDRKDEYAFYRP